MSSHCSDNLTLILHSKAKNCGCKLQEWVYGSHGGHIVFSTNLKPSDNSKLVIMAHVTG